MSNRSDTEFILREDCWIERNFVPIRQGPSCFQAHRLRAAAAIEPFPLRFCGYVKTPRQTHFYFLGEKIIGRSVAESLALKKFAKEESRLRTYDSSHS